MNEAMIPPAREVGEEYREGTDLPLPFPKALGRVVVVVALYCLLEEIDWTLYRTLLSLPLELDSLKQQ